MTTSSGTEDSPIGGLVLGVRAAISAGAPIRHMTEAVADKLRTILDEGLVLPKSVTVPNPDRYVMYPLYIDPQNHFSIAAAVWDVGQSTPVHGHETWGVVGILSGVENERRYERQDSNPNHLEPSAEYKWSPGNVTVCCVPDDDVHQVSCSGGEPVVGIHIYGADIGTLARRSYDLETGQVHWFTSQWARPCTD